MTGEEQLTELFSSLGKFKSSYAEATVKSVDETALSCVVVFKIGDIEKTDVRLKSTLNDEEVGFFLIPEVGSDVMVALLDEELNGVVSMTNQVSKMIYKNGALSLVVDATKMDLITENMQLQATDALIKLKVQESTIEVLESAINLVSGGKFDFSNAQTSLKSILNAIVTMVKQLTVSTGVGPSGTPLPPTLTAATEVETNVTNLFS